MEVIDRETTYEYLRLLLRSQLQILENNILLNLLKEVSWSLGVSGFSFLSVDCWNARFTWHSIFI